MERTVRPGTQEASTLLFKHPAHSRVPERGVDGLGAWKSLTSQGLLGTGPALIKVFAAVWGLGSVWPELWLPSHFIIAISIAKNMLITHENIKIIGSRIKLNANQYRALRHLCGLFSNTNWLV